MTRELKGDSHQIWRTAAQGPQPNLTSRIATVRGYANHDAMHLVPDGRDSNTLPQNRL